MSRRRKVFLAFLGSIVVTVGLLLVFIQSKSFASILKEIAREYMPLDLGVEGNFSELSVKLVPPGVMIKNPSITLKEGNIAKLPADTKVDAQYIDITFQFFQLLTGSITVNAITLNGATLKVDLTPEFFSAHQKTAKKSLSSKIVSWDSLVRVNFRSISLIDSQVDFKIIRFEGDKPIVVQTIAKELTIGKSTIENMPSYDLALDFQKTLIEMNGIRQPISQMQASVELSSKGAAIRNLGIQEGDRKLHVNGAVHGNLLNPKELISDFSYIISGPIPSWLDHQIVEKIVTLPKKLDIDGVATLEGKFVGDLMNFKETAQTKFTLQIDKAKYSEWFAEKATFSGSWKDQLLVLDSSELSIDQGKVSVEKIAYDFTKKANVMKLGVRLDHADLRKMLGPALKAVYPLHMNLTGLVAADLSLSHDFAVSGDLELKVRDFSFDNQRPKVVKPLQVLLAVPEIDLKGRFQVDKNGVKFDQTIVNLPHSKLQAVGQVNEAKGFDIDVKGNVDLSDIKKLGAFDIVGTGDLHWTIKGKLPDILFGFEAEVVNAHYLNLNLGHVKGLIVYNDGTNKLHFKNVEAKQGRGEFLANGVIDVGDTDDANMVIQVPRGTIQDLATVFDAFLKQSVPWYPYELTGQLNGVIKVSGKTPLDKLSVESDMEFRNMVYFKEIFAYGKTHAGYRRGAYIAENSFFRKKTGTISGNFMFSKDSVLDFDLKTDGFSTVDVDTLAALNIPYRAPLSFETTGTGKLGRLKSKTKLSIAEGQIKNFQVPRTDFSMTTENNRIHADLALFNSQFKGKLDLGLDSGAWSSLEMNANQFDFQPILVALNSKLAEDPELDAELNGSANLKFQSGHLSRLSGNVNLASYFLRKKGFFVKLAQPVEFPIDNGNYRFESARLIGDNFDLLTRGSVRDGRIDYKISGNFNLGFFEVPVFELASVRGVARVDATLFGRADSPNMKAVVTSSNSDVRVRTIEQPFEDVKFTADWNDSTIKVTEMSARFAGGTARGGGTVELYLSKAPDLDFKVDLDNAKVKVYPVQYARSSGKLSVKGKELPYKVKGNLHVAEAKITQNFDLNEGSRMLRSSKFLPLNKSGSGEFQLFELDLDIGADRNIFVKNDLFDAELKGNLKVINTIQAPRLLGNISVIHGKLLFKDSFFSIQNGNMRFANPAVIDPEFDFSGQTEVKNYKITMSAAGTVSEYKLNFQSQPPLSEMDIVSLLTLGVTQADYKSLSRENRDAYSRDELYGILFSQSGVNKGLEKFGVKGVKVRVDQSLNEVPESAFRAKSSSGSTETLAPKVVVQTEVTKNLNASVGSTVGVGESEERNVSLEYEMPFAKNISVLGTYEDQRGSQLKQTRTSVGADVKYKLRFKF